MPTIKTHISLLKIDIWGRLNFQRILVLEPAGCFFFPPTFSGSGQSTAIRTQLLKADGARERANFTPGSPSSPAVAAALGFGHRIPVARVNLTHAMEDFGEAVAFSDVCEEKGC